MPQTSQKKYWCGTDTSQSNTVRLNLEVIIPGMCRGSVLCVWTKSRGGWLSTCIMFALPGNSKRFVPMWTFVKVNNGQGNTTEHVEHRHNPHFIPRHVPGMMTRTMLLPWVHSVIKQHLSISLQINSWKCIYFLAEYWCQQLQPTATAWPLCAKWKSSPQTAVPELAQWHYQLLSPSQGEGRDFSTSKSQWVGWGLPTLKKSEYPVDNCRRGCLSTQVPKKDQVQCVQADTAAQHQD